MATFLASSMMHSRPRGTKRTLSPEERAAAQPPGEGGRTLSGPEFNLQGRAASLTRPPRGGSLPRGEGEDPARHTCSASKRHPNAGGSVTLRSFPCKFV